MLKKYLFLNLIFFLFFISTHILNYGPEFFRPSIKKNGFILFFFLPQDRTLVGGKGAPSEQDIQLSGLGIQPEHCVILVEDGGLFMEPMSNARSFVNGSPVYERTPLLHGDRILWGNHHFFRVNCPKSASKLSMIFFPSFF